MANLHKIAGMESKTSIREIDLMEDLARFFSYFKENILLAILFPLAGAAIGFFVCSNTEDKIESSMMVVTNLLTQAECDFLLTELEKSDTLQGVSPEQRAGLALITHKIISQPENSQSTPSVHIIITIQVLHHELLHVFEKSIVTYLEASRPAIRKKYEFHRFYTEMIAAIDRELASMQQFKVLNAPKTTANLLNPSALYVETVNLTEKKINYELRMKNSNIFQLIQGFDAVSRNAKLPLTVYILIGFSVGILALLPVLFIKYFRRYYKKYRQSHQP
jgi:hypothetical protein